MNNLIAAAGLALIAVTGIAETAVALAPRNGGLETSRPIKENRSVGVPLGFVQFCLENIDHCQGGGASSVRADDRVLAALDQVNRQVNRQIKARPDRGSDVWSVNVSAGDCEDYALSKRDRLMRMGFPASALRLAVAKTSWGDEHAVLVVRTDKGDFILDNLRNDVVDWRKADLRLMSMSGANPLQWRRI